MTVLSPYSPDTIITLPGDAVVLLGVPAGIWYTDFLSRLFMTLLDFFSYD